MLEELKNEVYEANMKLYKLGLIIQTWGNASGIDRESGYIVIKPSGISYAELSPEKMVVVDTNGRAIEGEYQASSDTLTHIEIYKMCSAIGGVVHTHSSWATVWAQAGKSIRPLGSTHADYFSGSIPCTRNLTDQETMGEYEKETGKLIAETFRYVDPMRIPAVLVKNHGPFIWGETALQAANYAQVLEEIAKLAYLTEILVVDSEQMPNALLRRHYERKHGENAYYGQTT